MIASIFIESLFYVDGILPGTRLELLYYMYGANASGVEEPNPGMKLGLLPYDSRNWGDPN